MNQKDLSIEEYFELLFNSFSTYIDYYESDLGDFLTNKLFKKYYLYIFLRVVAVLVYIITTSFFILFKASLISTVSGIISILVLLEFYYIDKLIYKKFKYTTTFFQRKGKILVIFKNKLSLLLENTYLSEKYSADNFEFEIIKPKSIRLINRIENDVGIIQPYSF